MDFTLKIYRKLLETLQAQGYEFLTFEQYCMLELRPQDESSVESPSENESSSIRALRQAQGPNEITEVANQSGHFDRLSDREAQGPNETASPPHQITASPSTQALGPNEITEVSNQSGHFDRLSDREAQGPNGTDSPHHRITASPTKYIILRHDVDLKAENSVATAQIEHSLGIKASYYFRVVPDSNKPNCIQAIAMMGHEIGYHYEDMSLCGGNPEKAVAHFAEKLAYFRTYYPVKTICMHGAPTSQYDSKDIWQFASYKKDFNLIGEPYFDVDFSDLFYLTDTGRRWDGYKVSVRDKIPMYQDIWTANGWVYKRTDDIIRACQSGSLPSRIMITTHPQRWTDSKAKGLQETIVQNLKNTIKYALIKWRSK